MAAGFALRLLAVGLARQGSLYAVDDYFSVGYPNIFLVIILAGLIGNQVVLEIATWFLVPMFALAPLDDLLLKRLHRATPNAKLMSYLRIDGHLIQVPRTGAWCCLDDSPAQAQESLVSARFAETANLVQSRDRL